MNAFSRLSHFGRTVKECASLIWKSVALRSEAGPQRLQTDTDRQRCITESFSKAVNQLGSDKLEVRLGGIYWLERISKESPDDYWTVMENLTAFVRERSLRNEAERLQDVEQRVSRRAHFLRWRTGRAGGRAEGVGAEAVRQDEIGKPPPTDLAAALTVIKRRNKRGREHRSATPGVSILVVQL